MQEQTKITVLLISVIIVAVISLLFIFYQYGKLQSQFTARIISKNNEFPTEIIYPRSAEFQKQQIISSCPKPNCEYNSHYRIGPQIIETGNFDANGKNIKKCHKENIEITVKAKNSQKITQLKCVFGGWTVNS